MNHIIALVIFLTLNGLSWWVANALYRATVTDHRPSFDPEFLIATGLVVVLGALTCFVPFPAGFILGTIVQMIGVFATLSIPFPRRCLLYSYLFACSIVARLTTIGVLACIG